MNRILVTGAGGQIGSELVPLLRSLYGIDSVLATDIRNPSREAADAGPFQILDCTDPQAVGHAAGRHRADTIFHLAAILSAVGERDPRLAYQVNVSGMLAVLDVARELECAVFTPSSIGVYGPESPADPAPQDTVMRPRTMYGVTKLTGELLCDYYHARWGVDTRGVRYPGLISHVAPPGGGTTDWAVEIFHAVAAGEPYTCFLEADTVLDMMYMPDALRAAVELMEADPGRLIHRNAFNVAAMQLAPRTLTDAICRRVPGFELRFDVDPVRQSIAESWPRRIDDSAAQSEWDWAPQYDADAMIDEMLRHLAP